VVASVSAGAWVEAAPGNTVDDHEHETDGEEEEDEEEEEEEEDAAA
jgi:hypothetical protein